MKSIIVTIQIKNRKDMLDIELPQDLAGEDLTNKVFDLLQDCYKECNFHIKYHAIYLVKQKRLLGENETLEQAGVLNGDYLTIQSRI